MFIGTIGSSQNFTIEASPFEYVDIPSPPTFSDSHTLIQATTGNSIQSGDTGGKSEFLIGSDYPFFQLNGLSGTYKIKSLDPIDPSTWATIGSGGGNDYSLTAAVATPSVEYYNLRLIDSDNIVKMPVSAAPKTQVYQNLILEDGGFGSFLINESVVGQDYGDLTISFCRIFRSGGESLYLGRTGASNSFFTGTTTISHIYSEDPGREALQLNGHALAYVTNITAINGGLDVGAGVGQRNCFQIQNVFDGYLKKSIFYAYSPAMIATQNFLFEDLYMEWTNTTREIYLQDMSANGYTEYENNGGTVTFRRCIFKCTGYTLDWVFRIQEEQCHYVFEDCIFPTSATDIYKDERSATPYGITVTNCTFDDSPPQPTFGPSIDAAYVGYEQLVTDDYFLPRGIGYRSQAA